MSEEKKMNEEDMKIYEEAVSIDRSRQKSRKIFVFYIVGLFCVALGLILVSYVMQAHANQQLEDLGAQLTVQSDAAKGAKARADQLQVTIDTLNGQLRDLKRENEAMSANAGDSDKALDAMNKLWQLEKAYRLGEYNTARKFIGELDAAYTREVLIDSKTAPLTGDAAKEYAEICDMLENN